mmetsp:Transcript_66692/g.159160  ORF Transcript_66692/g.159160 Transcript_66692/m.159160 type:complete len:264 (+) Transcript_66692:889-1680(+)
MNRVFRVVLFDIIDLPTAISLCLSHLAEELLVVLSPLFDWKLGDINLVVGNFLGYASNLEATFLGIRVRHNATLEATVPRTNVFARWLLLDELPQRVDDVPGIVVWKRSGPSGANSISSIHKRHRNYRDVPLRLDDLTLLILKVQQWIIVRMEDGASDALQSGVDVPRARVVLAALQSGSKLPRRHKQVDVVGANEVLRHSHNGALQRRFTVMISAVLCNVSSKLSNFDIRPEVSLECCIQDLPLSRLHAVDKTRNRSHHVVS